MSQNTSSAFQLEPRILLSYALRYWYLIVIGLVAGASYAYYQVRYTPATFSTNSRMLVKDEYTSWGQEYFLPGMELVSGRNRLINEIGIIRSFPLMKRVAKELDLPFSYYKVGNIKTTEMYPRADFRLKLTNGELKPSVFYLNFPKKDYYQFSKTLESLTEAPIVPIYDQIVFDNIELNIEVLSSAVYGEDEYKVRINSTNGLARHLQSAIQINVENQESSILILSHQEQNPAKSIDYLNTLMHEYIQWGMDQNNEIATNTIAFVDQQLRQIADSLVITEHRLEQFQKKNFKDRIFIQEEINNVESIFALEDLLTQRSIQREYYSALMKTLRQNEFTAFPSAAVFGFEDPNVDRMVLSLMEAINVENEKALQFNSNSQFAERARKNVELRKNDLYEAAASNLEQVNSIIDSLKSIIVKEERKVLKIPKEQREYFKLQRENKLLGDLYTFLLNKRSEASIAKASNVPKAQILDYADQYRVSYVGPKAPSIYGMSIFLGIAIPLSIIFLLYILNTKIIDPTDIERLTSIPVLGSVIHKKDLQNNIIVAHSLKSVMAEAFRNIRTKLNYMVREKACTKILVTSSISGEGKTFTSINLAAMYAASGKKTVLLGADLRKPKIFEDFDLKNDVGLSTYLINKTNLDEVSQPTKFENLTLISSGPIPPNPAELIESSLMRKFFQELEKIYEVVIIDSPPLGLVTDALLLKDFSDVSLYIVRHNYTKKGHLENINQLYEERIFSNIGIVVNAIHQKSGIASYGYGLYGYGYGYGYGYYSEDQA